jgi:hypothetical protein
MKATEPELIDLRLYQLAWWRNVSAVAGSRRGIAMAFIPFSRPRNDSLRPVRRYRQLKRLFFLVVVVRLNLLLLRFLNRTSRQ